MNQLEQKIADKIKDAGPITFEKFMDMALYFPAIGYYSSPERLIGQAGDFITSTHQHTTFGEMAVKQLIEMWDIMGNPSEFTAIEVGAGAGYLSKDIIDYLCKPTGDPDFTDKKRSFLDSLRYSIVEPFFHFRQKQRNVLKEHIETRKIIWTSSLKEAGNIRGCIFSNELLDAFPVHLIEMETI